MFDLKPLRDEYTSLHQQAETLINLAASEKRDLTDAEKVESDKAFSRLAEIKSVIDRQAKLAEFAFANKTANVELPSEPTGKVEQQNVEIKVADRFANNKIDRKEFASHVNNWLRTGRLDNRFATITGSTESGILMPVDVMPPIAPSALNTFRAALEPYGLEPWRTPSTRDINLPIFTAAAGSAVDPTVTTEVEQEPGLTESVNSQVVTYHSGNVWFENRELNAVDFDLFSATIPAMAYSKELAFESAIVTAIKANSGITQIVPTATTSGFTYANMVALNRLLPKRYQQLKVIVLSKTAYTAAENLVTTTGFPILNIDAQNSSLKRFNGTPVVYSEYLEDLGSGSKIVGLVFSWIGARLRDAGPGDVLQRFTQTANRQGQTGADLYSYNSFNYSNSAIGLLKTPVS